MTGDLRASLTRAIVESGADENGWLSDAFSEFAGPAEELRLGIDPDVTAVLVDGMVDVHHLVSDVLQVIQPRPVGATPDHEGDLLDYAERMLAFVDAWRSSQYGETIFQGITMAGPDDDRREVAHEITTTDLRKFAGLARLYAHHVAMQHAVIVQVKHYERGAETAEIIITDDRVVLDGVAVDELMTQSGWVEV